MQNTRKQTKVQKAINEAIERYLSQIDDYELGDLYGLMLSEVERALLIKLFEHTSGNLSRMSRILGLSRITLKKKLSVRGVV